jgi:hypothetical protein
MAECVRTYPIRALWSICQRLQTITNLKSMNYLEAHHGHHRSPSPHKPHSQIASQHAIVAAPIANPAHIACASWELCDNILKQLSCADLERIRILNRICNAVVNWSFFSHALHGLATLLPMTSVPAALAIHSSLYQAACHTFCTPRITSKKTRQRFASWHRSCQSVATQSGSGMALLIHLATFHCYYLLS